MKKHVTAETLLFYLVVVVLAAGLCMRICGIPVKGMPLPCALYSLYGIPCPGCGGTRAIRYLLDGQLKESFFAHPLVLYTVICGIYYAAAYGIVTFIQKKTFAFRHFRFGKTILAGAAILPIAQWILKLILW